MALVLIGFMGAGKSTLAGRLAASLGGAAQDSDALLEQQLGHSVADEFEQAGEAAFRAREELVVCDLLGAAGERDVVALGGGSVLSERVRAALAGHSTLLLDVDPELAWERVSAGPDPNGRPLARDRAAFVGLHEQRAELYAQLADVVLTGLGPGAGPGLLAALEAAAAAPAGTRLLWASSASGDYPVFVGRGLLGAEQLAPLLPAGRSFPVLDANVGELYGRRLGAAGEHAISIPPGEHAKTLATAQRVWVHLAASGMTRADHVLAVGGGVTGDLAGFCAATYQRGVAVVHVPTTLVAQVDSAYGGKTGVDLPQAKNYVGAYHQPAAVVVDPDTLDTLPAAELAAGWVEVLKTALIAGGALWARVAADEHVDDAMILACARTKLAVVASDERDAGRRQVLNLGHTVGHAIETATGYSRYRHGEAVGLGLLAALRLSGRDELRAQVRELLAAHGLPVTLEGVAPAEVVAATARDKKRLGERVPFVLVQAPGDVRSGCEVAERELEAAVQELAP
jgi:shikimate kinase/3-dehydroquinate synthase